MKDKTAKELVLAYKANPEPRVSVFVGTPDAPLFATFVFIGKHDCWFLQWGPDATQETVNATNAAIRFFDWYEQRFDPEMPDLLERAFSTIRTQPKEQP